jgi:hypothetical protein
LYFYLEKIENAISKNAIARQMVPRTLPHFAGQFWILCYPKNSTGTTKAGAWHCTPESLKYDLMSQFPGFCLSGIPLLVSGIPLLVSRILVSRILVSRISVFRIPLSEILCFRLSMWQLYYFLGNLELQFPGFQFPGFSVSRVFSFPDSIFGVYIRTFRDYLIGFRLFNGKRRYGTQKNSFPGRVPLPRICT